MKIENSGFRIRFIERDYLFNIIKSSAEYITDEQIYSEIDQQPNLCDVTFNFIPHGSGFATRIFDNDTDNEISLDDLNPVANNFYLQQVKMISTLQAKARMALIEEKKIDTRVEKSINKIREILSKESNKRNKFKIAQ